MTVTARLEVIPTRERGMSDGVARAVDALEMFDVNYETTATDTIVEADDADEVFRAAAAAHRAVSDGRVITSLEVDDQRGRTQRGEDRVAAVERRLGRPPRRERSERFETRRREVARGGGSGRYHAPRVKFPTLHTRSGQSEGREPRPSQSSWRHSGDWSSQSRPSEQSDSRYLRAGGH